MPSASFVRFDFYFYFFFFADTFVCVIVRRVGCLPCDNMDSLDKLALFIIKRRFDAMGRFSFYQWNAIELYINVPFAAQFKSRISLQPLSSMSWLE